MTVTFPSVDYNSPSALRAYLAGRDMAMQKKFGQNFLINADARKKLVGVLDAGAGTTVWEVGPGLGAMTRPLLDSGARVTAFEIDRGFIASLEELFASEAHTGAFTCVAGDVLKTWRPRIATDGVPERFFGNLPYNIAATLIADTITAGVRFPRMVVTVQKEVASRMCAVVGTKDYSAFSVLCRWAYTVTPVLDIGRGAFYPAPNVDSRAVCLTPAADFPACDDPRRFAAFVHALFASRRKTVKNNLARHTGSTTAAEDMLASTGVSPDARAETLDIPTLLALHRCCRLP